MAVTSATQVITVSVPANDAQGLSGDGTTYQRFNSSPFSIKVSGVADNNNSDSIIHFGLYEWDFSVDDIETYLSINTLRSAKIVMYYSNANTPADIGELGIYNLGVPLSTSNASLYTACLSASSGIIASVEPSGDLKTKVEYDFTAEISNLEALVESQGKFTVLFKPTDTSIGGTKAKESQILIGGMTLSRGIETGWDEESDISDPPRLVMEWEAPAGDHPQHLMKYTTAADPYSNQGNPSASLGGYVAPNLVHTRVQLEEDVSNVQTAIPIRSGNLLPSSSSGLVLVGSEIVSYTGLDSDNNQLTGITRSIAPPFAYPSISQPYPEYVHYLSVDSVFNTKPTNELVQYRCVGIQQQSVTSGTWETTFPKILLTQNPNSDVVIDIGVEIPEWDVHYGTFSAEAADGTNEVRSITATSGSILGAVGYEDGFFNGGQIIIDPDGTGGVGPQNHIIDSYEMDEGVAVFLLEDNVSGTIPVATTFRIAPAPSQVITNEVTPPNNNSGRFLGFLGDGGTSTILFEEHGTVMFDYDVFYVWIKRTLSSNKKSSSNSGAIITILAERVQ